MFGPDKKLENNPEHILNICNKIDVEVDAWFIDNRWFLGHDGPQYEVKESFFNDKMWIHCKNLQACEELSSTNLNWFWHENDKMTLTSKGYKWVLPKVYVKGGITVEYGFNAELPKDILGVCTDYPELYK